MSILVEISEELRALADDIVDLEVQGQTLRDAMAAITARHPALGPRLSDQTGAILPDVDVLIAGRDARLLGGLGAVLRDGSRMTPDSPTAIRRSGGGRALLPPTHLAGDRAGGAGTAGGGSRRRHRRRRAWCTSPHVPRSGGRRPLGRR